MKVKKEHLIRGFLASVAIIGAGGSGVGFYQMHQELDALKAKQTDQGVKIQDMTDADKKRDVDFMTFFQVLCNHDNVLRIDHGMPVHPCPGDSPRTPVLPDNSKTN